MLKPRVRWNLNIHYHRVLLDAVPAGTVFVCADVFTHPFEPASFDVVASNAMLRHVDAESGLRRMQDLVRLGGT